MRKIFLLLIFFSSSAFSQETRIDSLLKHLESATEKEKPVIFNLLSEAISVKSGTKAIEYAEKAFVIAQKYKNYAESGKALYNKSNAYYLIQKYSEAADYAVEAIKSFTLSGNEELIARSYMLIGQIYRDKNDYGQSLLYLNNALGKFRQNKDTLAISEVYNMLGSLYYKQYQYVKAIENYTFSYNLLIKKDEKAQLSKILCNMANVYRDNGDNQKALEKLTEAVFILNSENQGRELANVLNQIGSLYFKIRKFDHALEYYNKARDIRKEMKLESDLAAIYINIGLVYREKNMHTEALQYYINALELRKKLNDQKAIISTLNHIGGYYLNLHMYNEALRYYLDVLKLSIQYEDNSEMANALANIAVINIEQHNYRKAVDYLEYALKINFNINDYGRLAANYILLGNAYLNMKDYMTALQSYEEALEYRKKIGDESQIAATLINIGLAYQSWGKFKKAWESFNNSIEIRSKIKDFNGMAVSYNHLGNLFMDKKDTTNAQTYFLQSLKYSELARNKYQLSLCSRKIGEIYLSRKKLDLAFPYLERSLQVGVEIFNLELQRKAYYALHQYYSIRQEYKRALEYMMHYSIINDSNYRRLNNQYLMEKQIEAELNIKDKKIKDFEYELQNLRTEDQLKALKLKKQQNVIIFVAFIGFLFIIIGLAFYRAYYYKKQLNQELKKYLAGIEKANTLLRESEDELKKLNSTKDKFFSIIAHDLRNALNGILGLTKLLIDEANQKEESKKEVYHLLHESAIQLYALLTNLLEWSRSQTGRISYHPIKMDFYELASDNKKLLQLNADTKKITLDNRIMPETYVHADKDMVNTVLRNLVSNAIKFTPEKGNIILSADIMEQNVIITVEDDGVGISEENLKNMFKIDKHFSTQGTNMESGTGLGLILCKELIEKNKGEIWVESELGRGSRFRFKLPASPIA